MLKTLPAEILDSHVAVLGKTGVGKSGGIRASVIEPMLDAGERVCCIDPTDTQWGIRLTPAGKPSKYNVIVFGGNHGDRPLAAHEGEAIGEAVGTSSSSVIISTKKMRPRERTQFFTDFAEALLRTNNGILHLIIDEAHLFAPQSGGMGLGKEAAAMLHATNDLVSLGRGAGLCIVLATQRPAKIHKDSVSQCETLIAMRMSHPLDQAAIEDWIGLKRIKRMKTLPPEYLARAEQIMGGVQFLADRNAYVWAPDPKINVFDQIAFPNYKTFDSGERNKAGAKMILAPIDMTALEGKLKEVADEAEANDPAKLKTEIARLTGELAKKPQAMAQPVDRIVVERDPVEITTAFRAGFDLGYDKGAIAAFQVSIENLGRIGHEITTTAAKLERFRDGPKRHDGYPLYDLPPKSVPSGGYSPPVTPTRALPAPHATATRATSSPATGGDDTNSGVIDKMLVAMAELASLGVHAPSREIVAAMANYANIQSRPIREAFAYGIANELLCVPAPGFVQLTSRGVGAVTTPPRPLTTAEMRDRVARAVGQTAGKVLDELIAAYPGAVARETVAAKCGYANIQSRPIREAFAKLIGTGFVEAPKAGFVQASKILFP